MFWVHNSLCVLQWAVSSATSARRPMTPTAGTRLCRARPCSRPSARTSPSWPRFSSPTLSPSSASNTLASKQSRQVTQSIRERERVKWPVSSFKKQFIQFGETLAHEQRADVQPRFFGAAATAVVIASARTACVRRGRLFFWELHRGQCVNWVIHCSLLLELCCFGP